MKMSKIEKVFVNSPTHSSQVSHHAESLLNLTKYEVGQKYLDVGCGNGAAPINLAAKYPLNVTGVDVDPDQIKEAKKISAGINNVCFYTLDGTQLPFEDDAFDIVATNKVMHHVPGWKRAFTEMVRVLKPDGYLIYSDLVYPKWLAVTGKMFAGNMAGFPTKVAIEKLVAEHQLRKVYCLPSLMQYEAIFQKPY